jgi:hypothetical protein
MWATEAATAATSTTAQPKQSQTATLPAIKRAAKASSMLPREGSITTQDN